MYVDTYDYSATQVPNNRAHLHTIGPAYNTYLTLNGPISRCFILLNRDWSLWNVLHTTRGDGGRKKKLTPPALMFKQFFMNN